MVLGSKLLIDFTYFRFFIYHYYSLFSRNKLRSSVHFRNNILVIPKKTTR